MSHIVTGIVQGNAPIVKPISGQSATILVSGATGPSGTGPTGPAEPQAQLEQTAL